MMSELSALLDFARDRGMPVVWTRIRSSAPYSGIMLKKFPTIREDRILWKGEESFELFADMPQPRQRRIPGGEAQVRCVLRD